MHGVIPFLAMLAASVLLDAAVRPRTGRLRQAPGMVLHGLVMTAIFGFFLAGSGTAELAALLAIATMALFMVASNAKNRMLGEPLVFSDLALLGAMARHPRFYFTAISVRQRAMLAIGTALALVVLVVMSSPRLEPHFAGTALLVSAGGAVWLVSRNRRVAAIALTPDLAGDVQRYGLVATLLLYWWRWRGTPDPPPCPRLEVSHVAPEIIVIVQCESFADPVDIGGDAQQALPGLAAARAGAWQYGDLAVSGFGAYTMRTEYGVLFGRGEADLGFRRYDPFLSAHGETSYALSARLRGAGYRCSFVHPHDLRFYGRNRLMPAAGFDRLIGENTFAPRRPGQARYVDDVTLGIALGDLIEHANGPTLIYAVTMENHGPWDGPETRDAAGRRDTYLQHLRSSDAMLTDLIERLSHDRRSAMLVFFGDHRPSIPGFTAPGGARHTPYVIMRFDPTENVPGGGQRIDLTPADLHDAILRCTG